MIMDDYREDPYKQSVQINEVVENSANGEPAGKTHSNAAIDLDYYEEAVVLDEMFVGM